MNTNKFYVDDMEVVDPKRIGELHMLILLLLDTSGSMSGQAIRNLEASVNRFKNDIMTNPKVADIVDICVMGFNGEPYLIQNWRPVSEMNDVHLTASGGTNITAALEGALSKMRERTDQAYNCDVDIRVPWFILISDGYGGDVTEIGNVMRNRAKNKRSKLWFLGAQGYDKETAAKLTDGKCVFELTDEAGYDFTQFFDFMSESIKTKSLSRLGETIHVDDPTEKPGATIRKANLDDWLND